MINGGLIDRTVGCAPSHRMNGVYVEVDVQFKFEPLDGRVVVSAEITIPIAEEVVSETPVEGLR